MSLSCTVHRRFARGSVRPLAGAAATARSIERGSVVSDRMSELGDSNSRWLPARTPSAIARRSLGIDHTLPCQPVQVVERRIRRYVHRLGLSAGADWADRAKGRHGAGEVAPAGGRSPEHIAIGRTRPRLCGGWFRLPGSWDRSTGEQLRGGDYRAEPALYSSFDPLE